MKKNVLSAVLAVAATLCACTREPLDNNTDPTPEGEGWMTITAGLEGCSDPAAALAPETRTYLHTDGETPLWKDGDQFIIIGKQQSAGNERVYELKSGNGSTTATFGPVASAGFTGTFPYYAVYPSSLGISRTSMSQTINFALPKTQIGSENASGQMPAFAFIPTSDALSSGINFKNVGGLFRLSLTSDSSVAVGKLEIIDLAGNILWGNAHFDMKDATDNPDDPDHPWVWSIDNTDAEKSRLIVDYSASPRALSSTPSYFYAAVPPGALSGGVRVIIYDDSDNPIDEFCSGKNLSVTRAHIKPIKSTAVGHYTLLDLDGTANCYIVNRSETSPTYKFCATKGNGGGVTSINSAATLWETNNYNGASVNAVLNNDVTYAAGCISFSITGQQGNAVIAANDNSDNILWSWHIWLPKSWPVGSAEMGNGVTSMDRNLGAMDASSKYATGFLYQYGRKDPFVGPYHVGSYNTGFTTSPDGAITNEAKTDATIAWSIANPTVYIDRRGVSWDSANTAEWTDAKSIYDPCPAGWKVPARTDYNSLSFNSWDGDAWGYQETTSEYWFHGTGRLYYNSSDKHAAETAKSGYYWTTGHNDNTAYARLTTDAKVFTEVALDKGTAAAVRCVAE